MAASTCPLHLLLDSGSRVGMFLSIEDLIAAEQAKLLCSEDTACLWKITAASAASAVPVRGKATELFADLEAQGKIGKAQLRELGRLRRSLFLPHAWAPWVTQSSQCGLRALPCAPNMHPEEIGDMTRWAGPDAERCLGSDLMQLPCMWPRNLSSARSLAGLWRSA
mmetsp:Transcript_138039/g.385078  ORF Transcript_138039/g.385078 Transcript_138039/m.385078 type:complete len:166 (-) Transcript_138039:378-875(-)